MGIRQEAKAHDFDSCISLVRIQYAQFYYIRKEQNMTLIKILWAITIGAIVGSYTYFIKRDHYLDESNAWLLLSMYVILGVAYLAS